jgi:hypothetical protein
MFDASLIVLRGYSAIKADHATKRPGKSSPGRFDC